MTTKLEIAKKARPSWNIFNIQMHHTIPVLVFTYVECRGLEPPATNAYGVDFLGGMACKS